MPQFSHNKKQAGYRLEGETGMVQTIQTATHISVQGEFVKKLTDGRVVVRVGDINYTGKPIKRRAPTRRIALKAVAAA
jgi:hypothetical protein